MARLTKKKALEQAQSQEKVLRTVIYTRLSKLDNNKKDNEDSIENQVDIVKDYISDKEEFQLEKIYMDNGYKGTTFDRPAFKEMFEDIQNNKIDCVIVKDLSRLGRDYIQTGEYIQDIFPFYNVRFIAINNDIDTNNLNSLSNIILNFTNFSNNVYALDISKKSGQALRTLQEKGSFVGSNPPYGYNKVRDEKTRIVSLIIDEEVADYVRNIYKLRAEGKSYSQIISYLEDNDAPAPYEYLYQKKELKKEKTKIYQWNAPTLKRILTNEVYIGDMVQGMKKSNLRENIQEMRTPKDEWIRVENTHEPIVSKDVFYQVQKISEKINSDYHNNLKFENIKKPEDVFQGKLKCDCGGNLIYRRKVSSKNNKEYISFSYECPRHRPPIGVEKCKFYLISARLLREIIFNSIKKQITEFADLEKLMQRKKYTNEFQVKLDSLSKRIEKSSKELGKIIKIKESLYDDFTENLLNENEYILAKKKYQDKETRLKSLLLELEEEKTLIDSKKSNNNKYLNNLMSFKDEKNLTRDMVYLLIDEVRVHSKEDIEIIYNFDSSITKGGN